LLSGAARAASTSLANSSAADLGKVAASTNRGGGTPSRTKRGSLQLTSRSSRNGRLQVRHSAPRWHAIPPNQ
jgi:hypothetical protein